MGEYKLWDFLNTHYENVILLWVKEDRLSKRDRAILNQKLDRLVQIDFSLAIGMKLLAGPVAKHIYKLRAKGDVQLRPMLCRGPISDETEYTLLQGAVETGGKLPKRVQEQAGKNRQMILRDPSRRCSHERIT
jgi:hypothetical protein